MSKILSALALLLASAASAAPPVTIRALSDFATLDWHKLNYRAASGILKNLMTGLTEIDFKDQIVPGIAEKWTVSPDGKTYVFTLRPNARWSDQQPVEAKHFVDSFKRLLNPATASRYAYLAFDIEGAENFNRGASTDFATVQVKAISPREISIQLRAPRPDFPSLLSMSAFFPIREDLIAKHGLQWANPDQIVTNGAFVPGKHVENESWELKRNPKYFAPSAAESVRVLFIATDSDAVKRYLSGEIQVLSSVSREKLGTHLPSAQIRELPSARIVRLDFNHARAPGNDPAFRKAVLENIDLTELRESVGKGYVAIRSVESPTSPTYGTTSVYPTRRKVGSKNPKLQTDDRYTLAIYDLPEMRMIGQAVASQLRRKLGLNIELVPYKLHVSDTYRRGPTGEHLFLGGITGKFPGDLFYFESLSRDYGGNATGWSEDRYEATLASARGATGPARAKALSQAAQILKERYATVPLLADRSSALVSPRVTGFSESPYHYLDFRRLRFK